MIHRTTWAAVLPDLAFAYFTETPLLESWLTEEAIIEPLVGGRYELFWQPDDPENNSTLGCRITAFAADQVLAFQWRSPVQFKAFANAVQPLTHVTVSFIPTGGGTHIHLVHSGWRSNAEWEEARQWQERAWTQAFAVLELRLEDDPGDIAS